MPGNMSMLGDARRTILGLSLDKTSSASGTQSRIDKASYMTAMNNASKQFEGINIHDLKKARLLFKSMVDSKSDDPKAWQGAARIEEMDGKIDEARNIIAQGIEHCQDSEDVWYEAIRLFEYDNKKELAARAIKQCPKSVKLWLSAAKLENEVDRKVKVIKKGLQFVPQSEKLWTELIDLSSNDEEAKEFLTHAVQSVPVVYMLTQDNLEFRLALARLSPYDEAKEVINEANRYFKSEVREIWVHASKLEESNNNSDKCEFLISRGISKIIKKKNIFQRDDWIDEAQGCEKAQCMVTCRSIINSVFKLDMKEHDYTTMWLEDANLSLQRGNKETARTMFDVAVELDPKQRRLWEGYVGLEYRLEDHERYREVLKRAAKAEGDVAQPFLLKLSKEHLRSGNPIKAKELLKDAVTANPSNEVLSLAYAEILKQMKETDKCRSILKEAEQNIQTANIWKYHIKLERDMGDISKALEVSKEAVAKFPYDVDLACDLSIVYEELNKFEKSRENYISLIKTPKCQRKSRPWIQYMHLEEKLGGAQKARTVYEMSKRYIKEDPDMWYAIINLEERAANFKIIKTMLSEAVKECPKSGELWSMMIENQPKSSRIRATLNASEICPNDPYLMNVTARIFWGELKKEKATVWFERSLLANPGIGDTWVYYYLLQHELKDEIVKAEILKRCVQSEPTEGRLWKECAQRPVNWSLTTEQILMKVIDDAKAHMYTIKGRV